jgi:hypothetical protein
MVAVALLLTSCSAARSVTITSPCETDVLVDWVYRSQGGTDVLQENTVVLAGENTYADSVDTEYIALLADGEVLAETSLPANQLDDEGANPFPPITLSADACSRLTPAPASDSDSDTSDY